MNTKRRFKIALTIAFLALTSLGLAVASANTGEVFWENFEKPVVVGSPFSASAPYAYQGQSIDSSKWVRANQGYGSSSHGQINKDGGDFTAPAGNDQAYAFRYTNSGLTTAEGVIGALEATTYTVVFDVVKDGGTHGADGLPYNVQFIAFAAGAVRNDCRSTPADSTVLASKTGNAPAGGTWETVSFDITVSAGHADLGKDIGVRIKGATNYALIDNVQVLGPVVGPKFYDPRDGDYVPPSSTLELKWTNCDPTEPNAPVYVDVWFGMDPESLDKILEVTEENADANSVIVDASAPGWYYWRVDSYINGLDNINEPNRIEGPLLSFTNDKPPARVEVGVNMITWSGQGVPMDAIVYGDDGSSPLIYLWTANPPDGVSFDPSAAVEDPTVTITKATANPSVVTLSLAVNDATTSTPVTDSMTIDVYDDACAMVKDIDPTSIDPSDFDLNCITDIRDYAVLAAAWLVDYTPTAPFVKP